MTHADHDSEEANEPTAPEQGGDEEPQGGPKADELDKDPAYNPEDENLKGIKGG
jgi:hypothetical protein